MESTRSRIGGADASPRAPRPGVRRTGALVAAMVAAFALVSCTPTEQPVVVATPTPIETAEPTPTPTPTETAAPTVNNFDFGVKRSTVDELLGGGQEAFMAMPIEDRILVAQYYAKDLPEFADIYQGITKRDSDILPGTLSADNSPEEIMRISAYFHLMVNSIPAADNHSLDTLAAYGLLGSIYMSSSIPEYSFRINLADEVASSVQGYLSIRGQAISARPPMILNPDIAPTNFTENGRNCWTLPILDTSNDRTFDVSYCWVGRPDNTGMWVQTA